MFSTLAIVVSLATLLNSCDGLAIEFTRSTSMTPSASQRATSTMTPLAALQTVIRDGLDSSELSQWELSSSLDPSGGLLQAKRPAERLYNRAFHNPFSSAKIKDPFGPHSHVNAGRLSHDDQPPTVEERALVQESPSQTTIGIPQASSKSIMNIPVAATSDIPTLSATLEAPTPSNLSLVAQKNTTSSAINPDDPPPDVRYSSHINACHLFTKPKLEEREAKKKDDQPYDHPQEHGNTGSL